MLKDVFKNNWVIVGVVAFLLVLIKLSLNLNNVLSWDVFGYYLYLPAQFIYHDIGLRDPLWLAHIMDTYEPSSTTYQLIHIDNGNSVIKYTNGVAILLLPFFFLAHIIAEPLGYAPDGFSLPYQYIITLGGVVYALIGIWFSLKILRTFFSVKVATMTLVLIVLATNYFQLTAYDGTLLSHNFLFTLYAILIYFTIKWYDKKEFKSAIWIGITLGFMTLIRPSEVIAVLIPLLWFPKNGNYLKSKIQLVKNYYLQIASIGFLIVFIFSFQMIYWKLITGNFLFYSYTNPGEGLDFGSPHTLNFLFSFRKGWIVYTPLVLFAFWGWWLMVKQKQYIWISILVFYILHVYIASSWTTWWYAGGSFSSRSMMPTYALLMIPLGYFVTYLTQVKPRIKVVLTVGLILVLGLNLFQTWQFNNRILDRGRMTKAYYWRIFGKTSVTEEDKQLLLIKRSTETIEYFIDSSDYVSEVIFEKFWADNKDALSSFYLTDETIFSPGVNLKFRDLTKNDHAWIVAESMVFIPKGYQGLYPELIVSFHHNEKGYKYRAFQFTDELVRLGEWNKMRLEYLTPEVRTKDDNLKVYLWHRGQTNIAVKYLKVTSYNKKIE